MEIDGYPFFVFSIGASSKKASLGRWKALGDSSFLRTSFPAVAHASSLHGVGSIRLGPADTEQPAKALFTPSDSPYLKSNRKAYRRRHRYVCRAYPFSLQMPSAPNEYVHLEQTRLRGFRGKTVEKCLSEKGFTTD